MTMSAAIPFNHTFKLTADQLRQSYLVLLRGRVADEERDGTRERGREQEDSDEEAEVEGNEDDENADMNMDMNTGMNTDMNTGMTTDMNTDMNAEMNADMNADMNTTRMNAENNHEIDSHAKDMQKGSTANAPDESASMRRQKDRTKRGTGRQKGRKQRDLDYDLDDPFIDDTDVNDVYQSVFDLMRAAPEESDDDSDSDSDSDKDGSCAEETHGPQRSDRNRRQNRKEPAFFVYRGPLAPEVIAREFDIVPAEREASDGNESGADRKDMEDAPVRGKRSQSQRAASKTKPRKTTAPTKRVKMAAGAQSQKPQGRKVDDAGAANKPPRRGKNAQSKEKRNPADVIAQSAQRFTDLFSNETATVDKESTETSKQDGAKATVDPTVLAGADPQLLELREVLYRFREASRTISFSPGKFPSALRPRLHETISAALRTLRPTAAEPLPVALYSALAAFLPFTSTALTKLVQRKILGPLRESLERVELVRLYTHWTALVASRVQDDAAFVVSGTAGTDDVAVGIEPGIVTTIEAIAPSGMTEASASPVKKRLKFTDEMRQTVFDIVRTEGDCNALLLVQSLLPGDAAEDATRDTATVSRPQSDLNLRRLVYSKLVSAAATPHLSTTDISKEFGLHKRKHEKRIARTVVTMPFAEPEVEALLEPPVKPDGKKEPVIEDRPCESVENRALNATAVPLESETKPDPLDSLFQDEPVPGSMHE